MIGKLTLKQRKFWKCYLKTNNISASANFAGCKAKSKTSLCEQGRQILKSLELSMPELLEAKGLSTDQLGEVLVSQLKATKPLIATWEGKITDEKLYPDNAAIGKAIEHLGRMHGVFIDRHELTGKDGGDITISYAPSKTGPKKSKKVELDLD